MQRAQNRHHRRRLDGVRQKRHLGHRGLDLCRRLRYFFTQTSGHISGYLACFLHSYRETRRLAILDRRREHVYHAAMLDPSTAATLTLPEIYELVDAMIEAHGELIPTYLR